MFEFDIRRIYFYFSIMKNLKNVIITLLAITTGSIAFPQTIAPAFPTAEGYGMWASGGRGGKVVEVTSLQDVDKYGIPVEGSFRWALQQYPDEPITLVFRVSGIIDLKGSDIRSKRDNITIAGQTAPGDGICIKGGNVNLGGSNNLIIRHLRFRIGLLDNGGFIAGAGLGIENGGNFIIDHCTFGWSGEENMTIYDDTLVTVQWCLLHEGLYNAGHPKGPRSYGCQWGGQTSTYHHNLLAHNVSRTPRANGARSNDHKVLIEYANNVNYNWGKENSAYGGDIDNEGISHRWNMLSNYYKPGPARSGSSSSWFMQSSFHGEQDTTQIAEWFMSGNYMDGTANQSKNADNYLGLDASAYTSRGIEKTRLIAADTFDVPYTLNIESAEDALESVLIGAGAFPRDTVDRRIIHEAETGTAYGSGSFGTNMGIIDNPSAVGGFPEYKTYNETVDTDHDGMPDYWEKANGLDTTNAEDRNNLSEDGYTNLEIYLNGLVGEYNDDFAYPEPVYKDTSSQTSLKYPIYKPVVRAYIDASGNSLHVENTNAIKTVIIFDINGQIIRKILNLNVSNIDLTEISHGIYVSKFIMKNGFIQSVKFIK